LSVEQFLLYIAPKQIRLVVKENKPKNIASGVHLA